MTNFTPGPWRMANRTDLWNIGPNSIFIATLNDEYHGVEGYPANNFCSSNERQANAKLIKATPDLLEACQIAMEWFDDFTLDKKPYNDRPAADLSTIMFDAIKKATE